MRRISVWAVRAAALLMLGPALAACSGDRTEAVEELDRKLRSMPGVSSVTHEYENGDSLFGGSATFEVSTGAEAADTDARMILDVVYRSVDEDFGDVGVDVVLQAESAEYRLHVHDPSARSRDLAAVLEYAQQSRRRGETMVLELEALSENDEDFSSQIELTLPDGTDRGDVLPRVDLLRGAPENTDVLVRAADGSALSGFNGIPAQRDREAWSALNDAPHSEAYAVDLGPMNISDGSSRSSFVVLTLHQEPKDAAVRNRQRVEFMTAHLETLAAAGNSFRYYVNKGTGAVIQLDRSACEDPVPGGWRGEVVEHYRERTAACRVE